MTHEQVEELKALKRQETNLHRRITTAHPNSKWLEVMKEERQILIEKMKPLRDQLLSEIDDTGDRIMKHAVRLYYSGSTAYEVDDTFCYHNSNGVMTLNAVKKALRQVTNNEQ